MAWPNDTYWLCIETNFGIDYLSPNNGWPQCIVSNSKPNFIRVLGPYKDEISDPVTLFPVYGEEECATDNIVIYNNRYPDGSKNPDNWTTKGYYAYCPFNEVVPSVVVELRDLPPTRVQASKCIGPFYTKEDAQAATSTWNCKIAFTPASDVCSPNATDSPYPDLECSLVCSLGWPMIEGSIILNLFKKGERGSGKVMEPSKLPIISAGISCESSFEPMIAKCWKTYANNSSYSTIILIDSPKRGWNLRLNGTMCVDDDPNYVNVSVQMQALLIDKDANPNNPKPSEGSSWVTVGSLGGRLPALGGSSRKKRDERYYRGSVVEFRPTQGLYDLNVFAFAQIAVRLRPWVFGCDGSAGERGFGNKLDKTCGLFTPDFAYGCASVQVSPIDNTIPQNSEGLIPRPAFYQLGLNPNLDSVYPGDTYSINCIYCEPDNPNWKCYPEPNRHSDKSLTDMGIDGELQANFQQIQLAVTYIGDLGLKRISTGGLYLILKPATWEGWAKEVTNEKMVYIYSGWQIDQFVGYRLKMYVKNTEFPFDDIEVYSSITGNNGDTLFITGWKNNNIPQASFTNQAKFQIISSSSEWLTYPILAENIIQRRIPMIIEYYLNQFNARLLFYLVEFPSPEIAGCVNINDYPEPPPEAENPPSLMEPPIFPPQNNEIQINEIERLQKELEKNNKVCIYLGNAIPNTKACCGASPSFECEKHGRCKKYGVIGPDDNMVCTSCPDFS